MDFNDVELTPEQEKLRDEARAFFAEHVTEEVFENQRQTGNGFWEPLYLEMGKRGWIMPGWPVEEGGAGLDDISQRVLALEKARSRVIDITGGTTGLVWSSVNRYLDPELLAEIKPLVAAGHVRFCLGYTDPNGGSDIANATLRAVQDGDEWVLNGSKIFTTGAQNAQYTFLITRTDPDLPKHKGLTMFLVNLKTPGIEIQGIQTFGGERTNVVYYDDVRISDRYRLGPVNAGWSVLHGPLDEEHSVGGESTGLDDLSVGSSYLRDLEQAFEDALNWAATAVRADGTVVRDDQAALARLGKIATDIEVGRATPGPLGRVYGSEALVRGGADLVDLIGPEALITENADGAVGNGTIDYAHRYAQGTATYGGTVEVFRNIISQHVLGLPQMNLPGRKVYLGAKKSKV